ncbi:MAG: hypothetical protein IPJ19_02020 [Planctomycetes bacterium]|nr:hypothetical protein [Planctomycetota bacterium]
MTAPVQATHFEQAAAQARAGDYLAAWKLADAGTTPLEVAQARAFVRYHAGDLDGALMQAREGLRSSPEDPWLLSTATQIALALHRGAAAERTLASWKAQAGDPERESLERATADLVELRRAEAGAARGVRRAGWISAAGALLAACLLAGLARRPR